MARQILNFLLISAVLFAGCTSRESRLTGKWQSEMDQSDIRHKSAVKPREIQFEFFEGGTVVTNEKVLGKWMQLGTGSYVLIDPNHLKIDFGPLEGAQVYAFEAQGNDHLKLQAADRMIQLVRIAGK